MTATTLILPVVVLHKFSMLFSGDAIAIFGSPPRRHLIMPFFVLFFLFAAGLVQATSEPVPQLAKDLHPGRQPVGPTSAQSLIDVGGTLFFTAFDPVHGNELWKSDGTVSGTVRVKDLLPGHGSSFPRSLTAAGKFLYFVADDFQHGFQLWKSDGTEAGTLMVKDLKGDTPQMAPHSLTAVGDTLFFLLPTGGGAAALWTSDGTEEGTREVVAEANPSLETTPKLLTAFKDGVIYFRGNELYRSDGTKAGTYALGLDLHGTPDFDHGVKLFAGSQTLYGFASASGRTRIWKSNGAPEGTGVIVELDGRVSREAAVLKDVFLFNYVSPDLVLSLWKSDGTPSGTSMIQRAPVEGGAWWGGLWNFVTADDWVGFTVFSAKMVKGELIRFSELWRTDGTAEGTYKIREWVLGDLAIGFWCAEAVGNQQYWLSYDTQELWTSDGSVGRTRLVRDISRGSGFMAPEKLVRSGPKLFFVKGGQLWTFAPGKGRAEWPVQMTRLQGGGMSSLPFQSHARGVAGEGYALVPARDDKREGLWRIAPDEPKVLLTTPRPFLNLLDLQPAGKRVFAVVRDRTGGHLRVSDESGRKLQPLPARKAANPFLARWPAPKESSRRIPRILGTIGPRIYYTFTTGAGPHEDDADGTFSGEIWASDGSKHGTTKIREEGALRQTSHAPAGDETLFFWGQEDNFRRLWRTEGTAETTGLVEDSLRFYLGSDYLFGSKESRDFCRLGGKIYFAAGEYTQGVGLWCSDGTPSGTRMLKKSPNSSLWLGASAPIALGDKVLFMFDGGDEGRGLWLSDGTTEGTRFLFGGDSNYPFYQGSAQWMGVAKAGDLLFFATWHPSGCQLWKTDGTSSGTTRITPHPSGTAPLSFEMVAVGSTLYFTWETEMEGSELWKTDGTLGGARMVADLTGDSSGSSPSDFILCGKELLFRAETLARGSEIYRLEVSADLLDP